MFIFSSRARMQIFLIIITCIYVFIQNQNVYEELQNFNVCCHYKY